MRTFTPCYFIKTTVSGLKTCPKKVKHKQQLNSLKTVEWELTLLWKNTEQWFLIQWLGLRMIHLEQELQKLYKNEVGFILFSLSPVLQVVPVTAYLTVPVLELSCDMVDFQTCFVTETKTEHVFLYNWSGCRSYWTALLGILVLQLISLLQSFTIQCFFKTACTQYRANMC